MKPVPAAVWLLALALAVPAVAGVAVPEPEDYRVDEYRAPVPATLMGATVVGDAEAHRLWAQGETVFIDVLPRAPKPANLPEGTLWREKARRSIPGAIWLPNVGYGALAESTAAYFREGLARATGDDPTRAVLFFCLADCWMSWNAAKRAVEYGYSRVLWYPDGTDGWEFAGYPLEVVTPEPGG